MPPCDHRGRLYQNKTADAVYREEAQAGVLQDFIAGVAHADEPDRAAVRTHHGLKFNFTLHNF